jgi:hypothetical protein
MPHKQKDRLAASLRILIRRLIRLLRYQQRSSISVPMPATFDTHGIDPVPRVAAMRRRADPYCIDLLMASQSDRVDRSGDGYF